MLIERLQIKNFRGIKSFSTNFASGLNLLIGPNGSGKTSILEAINTTLYSAQLANRADSVHVNSETSQIIIDFSCYNQRYRVIKNISRSAPTQTLLKGLNNPTDIVGTVKVITYLKELIGDPSSKFSLWYIPQQRATQFIETFSSTQGAGTLTGLIEALLGIDKFVTLQEQFNKQLNCVFPPELEVDKILLESQLRTYKESIDMYKWTLSNLASIEEELEQTKKDLQLVEENLQALQLRQQQYKARQRLAELYVELKTLTQKTLLTAQLYIDTLKLEMKTKRKELNAFLEQYNYPPFSKEEKIDKIIFDLKTLIRRDSELEGLRREIKELKTKIFTIFSSRPKNCSYEYHTVLKEYGSTSARCASFEKYKILKNASESEILEGNCPFCGQSLNTADLQHMFEEYRNTKAVVAQLEAQVDTLRRRKGTREHAIQNIRGLINRYKTLATKDTGKVPLPGSVLQDYIDYFITSAEQYEAAKINLDRLFLRKKELEKQIDSLQQIISDDSFLTLEEVLPDELEEVRAKKKQLQTLLDEQHTKMGLRTTAINEISRLTNKLTKTSNDLDAIYTKLKKKKYCQEFMKIFIDESKKLSRLYLLNNLIPNVNLFLLDLEAPFQIKVSGHEDLQLIAVFSDGKQLPIRCLSYGQKVIVSLLLIFLFYIYNNSTGVLLADEPTAGLDDHNVAGISSVLVKLHSLCEAQRIQCIFATHQEMPGQQIHVRSE